VAICLKEWDETPAYATDYKNCDKFSLHARESLLSPEAAAGGKFARTKCMYCYAFLSMQGGGMYLMILLPVNGFFVQHQEIPTRKDFFHV
jgi:hypothetical protein